MNSVVRWVLPLIPKGLIYPYLVKCNSILYSNKYTNKYSIVMKE